jgi:serine/threonine-protein kinase
MDVGSVIADTYTIEAVIGRGGMGAVFLASHRRLPGKKVAIKLLHAELTDDEVVARFRREALIASQLNHPNIVDVTDFNVTPEGMPYLVLEYLQGESLAQRIKDGPMPLEHVLSIIRQVGSAVAAAHRENIIHRDLKPQNIFLVPKEVDGRLIEIAKVLDFGISKIRGSQTIQTQESTLLGTPQYMAPEQATGQHSNVDERTDVFALGAIVYEMLSGDPAFAGANIPEVVFKVVYEEPSPLATRAPGVPPEIASAVARAMTKDAAARFPTVGAFVEALTGKALLSVRTGAVAPPEIGFAVGSAAGSKHRHTGHDAFAQTMGSVDQSALPGALPRTPIDTSGQTLPPERHPPPTIATVDERPPRPSPQAPPTPTPTPRRRTALLVASGLALAAAAGVVAFVAMRPPAKLPVVAQDGSAAGSAAAVGSGSAGPAGGSAPAPPDAAQAAVALVPVADAAPPAPADAAAPPIPRDAGATATRPPRGPDQPAGSGKPEAEDEAAKAALDNAQAALAGGQYERAERLANTVITSPDAQPRQRARAYAIHGIAKCTAQKDQEAAVIDLRNLRGFRALQSQLVEKCLQAGVDLR